MMKMLLYNAQRAVFQKLSKNTDVGIFDYYPEADKETFPIIIIEGIEKEDNDEWSTRDGKVVNISITLDVWGFMKDRKKVNELLEIIEQSLQCDLTVDNLLFEYEKTEYVRLTRTQDNFNNGSIRLVYRTEEQ